MGSDVTVQAEEPRARPYRSERRRLQARRTRQRILASAAAEFSARGYAATTVAGIAAVAGVSVPTIEQVFRTKVNLLQAAIDWAIAGDDEPSPILDRQTIRSAAEAPVVDDFLAAVSAVVVDVAERAAGLVLVALEAAAGESRLQSLAEQLRSNRDIMAGWIVDELRKRGALRRGIDRREAVDVVWLLMDPAVYTRLRAERGWSRQRFREWFADSTARLVTDSSGRTGPAPERAQSLP
ncbi:TetR/AcrR family transcriptional regulator [Microlunatus sp. Gsoil 973]|jgi:AcrR family transcriptional regulator|uniref:TetR/AcrR family transcriptional regulator n=1 Tax=Microlunatus sp. Gsoil 973 TaxID=2672569 RepID=UPI0018A84C27|nr:TetR/AcrR family transcriptional regulator [Microlunatus sp. Gsoil 973]